LAVALFAKIMFAWSLF